jgi:putative DNA methylase
VQSFIETQFPVSRLSKESYAERVAVQSQTLTGLGKWWGRKPLVLARATILGLLLPASDDPHKDREIFLKLMTMDEEGLWRRKCKNLAISDAFALLSPPERQSYFGTPVLQGRPRLAPEDLDAVQRLAFSRLSYDEQLNYCNRPEQVDGPSPAAWSEVNRHLGTSASSLPELVQELGERRWGRRPRVGDAFCGGGSIPFEAARIGCEAYGSDLNPVAALLTWAALNIVGGGDEVGAEVREVQQAVYAAVDRQITEWGIEHNERGWRTDAFLYCSEAACPECGWRIPLASSWLIGPTSKVAAVLSADSAARRFRISVEQNASPDLLSSAKKAGTLSNSALKCPHCGKSTPLVMLRGDRRGQDGVEYGLRLWENEDVVPRPEDVFGERLYCIRWVETFTDENGRERTRRHFRAPTDQDLRREARVLELLQERFAEWQEKGYIPSRRIEPGEKTDEPIRTRGWTHWHHLFTPRQLLLHGLLLQVSTEIPVRASMHAAALLGVGRCCNWNSKLCSWGVGAARESIAQTFYNQALNTLHSFAGKGQTLLPGAWFLNIESAARKAPSSVILSDARTLDVIADLWITDPPYADAINYHELTEFFLAWYDKSIQRHFSAWYTDSKRALAVVGADEDFRQSMVECYRNLSQHMPDDGMQVVMFTHQDAAVWADLALILWAAGLRVTAAWTIATETSSALKTGNYVQGTVLLVLRKQTGDDVAFLDEIYPEVQREVKRQLDQMLALDDDEDPNFGDTDYQLAAYAAALRVLTQYSRLGDLDLQRELSRPRMRGEVTVIEEVIANAVKIAADHLVPKGFDTFIWKNLTPEERFYLKGLDLESHGELRAGAYQELARGFGVRDYGELLESGRANETRVRTATGFGRRTLGGSGFGVSLVRNALFAVREAVSSDEPLKGRTWLQNEMPDYWNQRTALIEVLRYLGRRGEHLEGWKEDARVAALLAGSVENHHV